MSGPTTPVATWLLPLNTTMDPTTYKGTLDGNAAVAQRVVDAFAPHAQAVPNMTIALDAGALFNEATATITEVAAQNTGTITAPASNSRIDRVVINQLTGVISVITGTPGVSPTPPALTTGVYPIAQILLTSASTSITNSMITDERVGIWGTPTANPPQAALTWNAGGTTSWNAATTPNATITGTGGNTTMGAPSGLVSGNFYTLEFIQDPAVARTITWNSIFKWPGGVAPVLSTTLSAHDFFTFFYNGTNLIGSYLRGVA